MHVCACACVCVCVRVCACACVCVRERVHRMTWAHDNLEMIMRILQHTATHCNKLQHAATRYNTKQHTAAHTATHLTHTHTHIYTHTHTHTHTHTPQVIAAQMAAGGAEEEGGPGISIAELLLNMSHFGMMQ